MSIIINEITMQHVKGFNQRAILNAQSRNKNCKQEHRIVREDDLRSCLAGIFYQSSDGYLNLPIEKMAALLMYRISQGQFFMDGNKRTGLIACYFFLSNNGYELYIDEEKVNDLIWGFTKSEDSPAKYTIEDAVNYIKNNIFPIKN